MMSARIIVPPIAIPPKFLYPTSSFTDMLVTIRKNVKTISNRNDFNQPPFPSGKVKPESTSCPITISTTKLAIIELHI